ncbi:MAG TPA: hypothetical protein VHD56_15990 [Tepidisphaeraceae bacterium]|nr:hypothetical protein [Tepidisphaeraceae bacterium]
MILIERRARYISQFSVLIPSMYVKWASAVKMTKLFVRAIAAICASIAGIGLPRRRNSDLMRPNSTAATASNSISAKVKINSDKSNSGTGAV